VNRIPFPALFLGYAGLAPFLYGVWLVLGYSDPAIPDFGAFTADRAGGLVVLERFGATVLAFMSGSLWGFAVAPRRTPGFLLPALPMAPALVAAVAIVHGAALSCIWLASGFALLQAVDLVFHRTGAAPGWWLRLRLPLTAAVIACLLAGALHG
jgi:hypothetical protein